MTWQHEAACAGLDPDAFASTAWADHAVAARVCVSCPVTAECAALAESIAGETSPGTSSAYRGPDGTWAGVLWRHGRILTRMAA